MSRLVCSQNFSPIGHVSEKLFNGMWKISQTLDACNYANEIDRNMAIIEIDVGYLGLL